eukprot:6099734-Prymnesium_polylepis.2
MEQVQQRPHVHRAQQQQSGAPLAGEDLPIVPRLTIVCDVDLVHVPLELHVAPAPPVRMQVDAVANLVTH